MKEEFQKFIVFTNYGEGLPIAKHLLDEGNTVIIGMVSSPEEDLRESISRFSQHSGFTEKMDADKLLKKMEKFPNKEEWFLYFDLNELWEYAQQALDMGFTNGIFPAKLDHTLENDREMAKKFVQDNYPGLKVAEVEEFKTIEEGLDFIENSDEFWALKGNDDSATTVVPASKNLEFAKTELADALIKGKEDYEKKGFILERQIRDGIEFCPQLVWYNGIRVAATICYEDKNFGPRGTGRKYGCSIQIVEAINLDAPILNLAFPPITDKLAKKHVGLFVMDANIIMKDGEYYFLEFCSNRFGYDCVYAEMDMSGGASDYFNDIAEGEIPYDRKFGASVRVFNTERNSDGTVKDGLQVNYEHNHHVWPFGIQKDGNKMLTTQGSWGDIYGGIDLCCVSGSSDDPEYAIQKVYKHLEDFSLKSSYWRQPDDFDDESFSNAPMGRMRNIRDIATSPDG